MQTEEEKIMIEYSIQEQTRLMQALLLYLAGEEEVRSLDERILAAMPQSSIGLGDSIATINGGYARLRKVTKGSGEDLVLLTATREAILAKVSEIGKSMKYANPLIWLLYKYLAYKDGDVYFYISKMEPRKAQEPILTLKDLRLHCTKDKDAICKKRFEAINTWLKDKYGNCLADESFLSGDTGLSDVARDPRFLAMCADTAFIALWLSHENDTAGKWKNYGKCESLT